MPVTSNLDAARIARIRARLDGACAEFDAGIDKIVAEIENLRAARTAIGFLAERLTAPPSRAGELPDDPIWPHVPAGLTRPA